MQQDPAQSSTEGLGVWTGPCSWEGSQCYSSLQKGQEGRIQGTTDCESSLGSWENREDYTGCC